MTGMCFSDPDRDLFLCTHLLDLYQTERYPHMPTFPDYPEVSRIWHWSPALPYRSPNLPGKMNFIASLHLSLQFSPFFLKIQTFFIYCTVSGTFLHISTHWERLCFPLYNDESEFWYHVPHVRLHIMSSAMAAGSICGARSGGGGAVDIWWGGGGGRSAK